MGARRRGVGQGEQSARGRALPFSLLVGKRGRREPVREHGPSSSAPPWAARGAANHRPTLPPF